MSDKRSVENRRYAKSDESSDYESVHTSSASQDVTAFESHAGQSKLQELMSQIENLKALLTT